MATKAEQLLTEGLVSGFAGETTIEQIDLSGLKFKRSRIKKDGDEYLDHWLPGRSGLGFEISKSEGESIGRTYAGGVVEQKTLSKLRITEGQIIDQLKVFIRNLGDKTRLNKSCGPILDGIWTYIYEIVDQEEELGLFIAKETIRVKGTLVFVHGFIILPL